MELSCLSEGKLGTHAGFDEVLVFGVAIIGKGVYTDSSSRGKNAGYFYILGIHQTDQVFHNDVHTVLVEIAVVAERKQIQFE